MILDVKRVEKKYMTDPVHARILKQRLAVYMKEDEHNGRDGYVVRLSILIPYTIRIIFKKKMA